MPVQPDRRRFARRPLNRDIYCYIDGVRLDGVALDVSPGGMFLEVPDPAEVPIGSPVALVFRSVEGLTRPLFLFGRAVRGQTEPVPGIGVCWERAVNAGGPDELERFLSEVCGIDRPVIEVGVPTHQGGPRNVYTFAPPPVPEPQFKDRSISTRRLRPVGKGVVSRQVMRASSGAPARVDATVTEEGQTFHGTIRRLGMGAMSIETRRVLKRADVNVAVRFDIPAADGVAPVTCTCRFVGASAASEGGGNPLLHLEVLDVDEGSRHGIVERYVKWLHLKEMA
ncbi:MAG: PilZ domain-containing protein [Deltaproteobacteria bacterium]|nr:PilZ domain-containing protein [Deltaproteobacteria bacterium]